MSLEYHLNLFLCDENVLDYSSDALSLQNGPRLVSFARSRLTIAQCDVLHEQLETLAHSNASPMLSNDKLVHRVDKLARLWVVRRQYDYIVPKSLDFPSDVTLKICEAFVGHAR